MTPGTLTVTVVDHEQHRSKVHTFDRGPVRVGRDPENELHLAYRFVSSWHAVIRFDARSARVEDLGSANGFKIDGERVPSGRGVEIRGRLTVQIGPIQLILEHAAEADARAAHGAIDTDEPSLLVGGHTMALNLAKVHATMLRLRPIYDQLAEAHAAWDAAEADARRELEAADDEAGLALLRREFPPLREGISGPEIVETGNAEFYRQAELGIVAGAAEALVPGLRGPADLEETRRFLARVVDVLRAHAVATTELLAATERQDRELGLSVDREHNPVLMADSPEELLRVLLDWRGGRVDRTHQLVEALAAALAHTSAILRGSLAAGRRISERLGPREIERSVDSSWPTRAGALWRRFEERYEALFGDGEDGWSRVLRSQVARTVGEALTRAGVAFTARPDDEENP